jgi:type IV pilus assembly protein PilY1
VDNSGSMELKSSSDQYPVCDPTTPNTATITANEKSRWIELLETLTGTVQNYACYAEKRDLTTNFKDEFELSPTDLPYDLGYPDPYHRPLSNGCAPGPGILPPPTTPYAYPVGAITYRPFQSGAITLGAASPCQYSQTNDGLLDAFNGSIRFGLMTFDPRTDPGTGVVGGVADNRNGLLGTWSYYLTSPSRCRLPGSSSTCVSGAQANPSGCCVGSPESCPTPSAFEVGARNAAAPPWEGRMVGFGPSATDGTLRDQWIQEILLATRPWGGTPIAGMLSDARDYIWNDDTPDPLNAGEYFGPSKDPLVQAKCRPNYIILLTDGEPNLDLRPSCVGGSADHCPYDTPETIVNDLVTSTTNPQVRTFVVGFSLGRAASTADGGSAVDCATMNLATECSPLPADDALRACCVMNNIAFNGTPVALRGQPPATPGAHLEDHAFFPKTPTELRSSLSQIFQKLLTKTTGRTYPVTTSAGGAGDKTGAAGFEFTSGTLPLSTGLWQGVLTRSRITCDQTTLKPSVQPVDPNLGDDFVANVNSAPDQRTIFTVVPDQVGSTSIRQATWSIRPFLESAATDGAGHYSGAQTSFAAASSFATNVPPEAMNVTSTSCGPTMTSATGCRTRLLDWAVGLTTATPVSRCTTTSCSVVGDIFHSTPQIRSGQPSEFLRDSTYADWAATLNKRDTMLYTSSNDGFFHGFVVTPGDPSATDVKHQPLTNKHINELWAFIPPAVLPSYITMYPGDPATPVMNRIPALDGVAILKDVGATKNGPRALTSDYPYRLERKKAPDSNQNEIHTWRTIMVQAFGAKRGGYFAVDVTTPAVDPQNPTTTGPKFLWQLSTDDAGNALFGKGSSTPLITTLYMKTNLSPEPNREVAVAVLPGGLGDGPTTATTSPGCDPDKATYIPSADSTSQSFRSSIRCYGATGGSANSIPARSLTFVRLDTGEIIRTFRPSNETQPVTFPSGAGTNVTDYTWDANGTKRPLYISAPIVGQPVAYPAQTGSVADRIFVGDAEGRIWRVDVSKPDPAEWAMNVFFDPYIDATNLGQPIQTPPVLSVDAKGQITVAFSTGDQDNLAPDPDPSNPKTYNYVTSVTEVVEPQSDGSKAFKSFFNWREEYKGGKRVLGPMTLFDRTLYYSTFMQTVTSSCTDTGVSSVYAIDYVQPKTAGSPTSGGNPVAGFPKDFPNVVIAGVGLRQLPSCSSTPSVAAAADAFLGYGTMTTTTTTNPGTFELVIQKGGSSSSTSNTITTQTIQLAAPKTSVRIDSWAPIIE